MNKKPASKLPNEENIDPFEALFKKEVKDSAGLQQMFERFSLKRSSEGDMISPSLRAALRKEASQILMMSHPNFPQVKNVQEDDSGIYVRVQHCEGEPLSSLITLARQHKISNFDDLILPIFSQICAAVQHMHSKNLVHRNLKPEVIRVTKLVDVKIVEFGLEKLIDMEKGNIIHYDGKGDVCYMAPEVMLGGKFSKKSDIWSLGLILFTMCTKESPMNHLTELDKVINERCHESFRKFVKTFLKVDQEERPSIEEVIRHPLLQNITKTGLIIDYQLLKPILKDSFRKNPEPMKEYKPSSLEQEKIQEIITLKKHLAARNMSQRLHLISEKEAMHKLLYQEVVDVGRIRVDEECVYDGMMIAGKPHMKGTAVWHEMGFQYEGEWRGGLPHGNGRLTNYVRGILYEGHFHEGVLQGKGKMITDSGEIYTGEFKNGKFHGRGTYVWPSKCRYVGEFADGLRNGKGVYFWPDKRFFDGCWKEGKQDGVGELKFPIGITLKGEWKNGSLSKLL